jgi:hypothetical protein
VALLHGVVVMMVIVNAMRLAHLVTRRVVRRRRVMGIGIRGKRCQGSRTQYKQAKESRTAARGAFCGEGMHGVLLVVVAVKIAFPHPSVNRTCDAQKEAFINVV